LKFGALTDMFPRNFSMENIIDEAAKAGYDGLEIGIGPNYWNHPIYNKEERRKIIEHTHSAKIEIASLCAHFLWNLGFAHPDERIRSFSVDLVKDTIEIAREMEAKVILLPAADTPLTKPPESYRLFKQSILGCVETAEKKHVILAVEGVGREFMKTANQQLAFVKEVDSKWVGAYFDVGNSAMWGFDPAQEIRLIGPYLAQVHVKDTAGKRFGQGTIDFKAVMKALRDVKYDGYLIVELAPYGDDPTKAVYESIAFLKKL